MKHIKVLNCGVVNVSNINELIRKGKLKKAFISKDMYLKEFAISGKDLSSAKKSFEDENYKWSTIQAYYAVFHAVRALVYKSGIREESHAALKTALRELYVNTGILSPKVYFTFEKGMNLREMADYKETFSKNGAESLIEDVQKVIEEISVHFE